MTTKDLKRLNDWASSDGSTGYSYDDRVWIRHLVRRLCISHQMEKGKKR